MDNREQVEAIQRMQSYIDSHLHEPITLHMQAAVVRMETQLQAYLTGDRNLLIATFLNEPWHARSLKEAEAQADAALAADERLAQHFAARP